MKFKLFIFLFFSQFVLSAQVEQSFDKQIDFLIYLFENNLFEEVKIYNQELLEQAKISPEQIDTVNYVNGFLYFGVDSLVHSREFLSRVSDRTNLYYKSKLYESYLWLKIDKPDSSIKLLNDLPESTNNELNQLIHYQLSASYLLNNDLNAFDLLSKGFKSNVKELTDEQQNIVQYADFQRNYKRKSPLMAGVLSTIVPGLGKVYAGNASQGLAAFLRVAILGTIAVENYLKLGLYHPQTLVFSGLFAAYYFGNIWGSAVSVQLVKYEKSLENKSNILIGVRIPLKKFFN